MVKFKQLAFTATAIALVSLFTPLAADASLYDDVDGVLAELFFVDPTGMGAMPADSSTELITSNMDDMLVPEFTFDLGATGQQINQASFTDPDGINLTISTMEGSVASMAAERWWRFSSLSWGTANPGMLMDVTFVDAGFVGEVVLGSVTDTSFMVRLAPVDNLEPNTPAFYGFALTVSHEGNPGIPIPGTVFLLGAGLIALSQMRRK